MMQQLYIDGRLADVGESTDVAVTIASNILNGMSEFKGNRSLTVTLPSTVHNRDIIRQADKVQVNTSEAYIFHNIDYWRDGVPIIKDGVGRLLSASPDSIQIAVTWGVRESVDAMLGDDIKLNDLPSNAAIVFNSYPQVSSYADAQTDDVFYAKLDCRRHEGMYDYYRLKTTFCGKTWETNDLGAASQYMHPSVRMNWILAQLESRYSMSFEWPQDAQDYIDTMIVPLVSKVPNDITFNAGYAATMGDMGAFGSAIPLATSHASAIIKTQSSPPTGSIECATAFSGLCKFSVYFYINEADLVRVAYPVYRVRSGYFVRIMAAGEVHDCVLIPEGTTVLASDITSDHRVNFTGTGFIPLEMDEDDTLSVFVGSMSGGAKNANDHTGVHVQGGNLFISEIVGSANEVQPTQLFPVEGNLPQIKPIDLLKFLCAVTGTFPVQSSTSSALSMRTVKDVFDWAHAADWSDRLLSPTSRPVASNTEYAVDDWAQRNWIRWKSDETVHGDYDGFIGMGNATLDAERDIIEFPFAASDGNNVPMYTSEDNKTKWNKVEPRVLRMREGDSHEAEAFFDMDMSVIVGERYGYMVTTLAKPVVITETVAMSDVELSQVDESKAVYLRQHGAYFAILSVEAKNNGTALTKLLKLKKTED